MAKRRLQSLEKKFENCPETRERYAKSIQDDIEKGYVKKLSEEEEVQCDSKVTWYLPHRCFWCVISLYIFTSCAVFW